MSTEHIGITSPSPTRRWNLDIRCIVFFATRVINENQKIRWHCIINANIARSVASTFVCIGGGKGAEIIIFLVDLPFRGRGDARTLIYLFRLYALHVVSSRCLAGNTRYCALPNANPNCQMAYEIQIVGFSISVMFLFTYFSRHPTFLSLRGLVLFHQ